ncbi:glycosyltransferase [Bacillus thuringiensis]
MKKPLISVILPIYNVEMYIEECLNSLVNQTIGVENLEVIMVNDCSTDNTGKFLDQYAENYNNFKAIHLEKIVAHLVNQEILVLILRKENI